MSERRSVRPDDRGWIEGRIPYLHWKATGTAASPVIIYMSGGGGRKEEVPAWIVERVTSAGVSLVSIDMPFHGERADREGTSLESGTIAAFGQIVDTTVSDLGDVIGHLREDWGIEDRPIAVRAISLSAICSLAAVAAGVSMNALLSICGSADYPAATAHRLQREGLEVDAIEGMMLQMAALPSRLDPMRNVPRFAHLPLFMIHGQHDQSLPLDSHRRLFEAVAPYHIDHPEDCLFLTHAGTHGIRPALEEMGWSWLIDRVTRPHAAEHGRAASVHWK